MQNMVIFGSILYATLALFFGILHAMGVNGSAYTSHVTLMTAIEWGLAWPWSVLHATGLLG